MLGGEVGATNIPKHSHHVQHVERIVLTKYTLIAVTPAKYTHCAACDYATSIALLGGVYCDAHPQKTV